MADTAQTGGAARVITLPRVFWVVASGNFLILLGFLLDAILHPSSEFGGIIALFFAVLVVLTGVMMGIVALIRKPAAYGVGLALALWPYVYYGGEMLRSYVTTPSEESLDAGHGYFDGTADRDLADAIMAGDSRKVASLAPAANLNAVGWNGMTFMRLAVIDAHAKPDVVVALLKAGANPDQDNQVLFGAITDGVDADSGAMITGKNERLLRAVIAAKVDLNQQDQEGNPRFLSAIRWPAGLAILLDHGANTEAEGKDGYTALMWTIIFEDWSAVDVLLAHGAHLDHVAHDGKSPRSLLLAKLDGIRKNHDTEPPELAALEARLHQPN